MKKTFLKILLMSVCSLPLFFLSANEALAVNRTETEIRPIVVDMDKGAIDAKAIINLPGAKPAPDKINAVSGNALKNLAERRDAISVTDNLFSSKIKAGKATDQKRTGRCWSFSTLNVLRPIIAKKYNMEDFELSQNYMFFWDKMEKSNFFLELVISSADRDLMDRELRFWLKDPIPDGGHWNYSVALIKKYGVIPKSSMGETEHSNDSRVMNTVLAALLRKDAAILRKMSDNGSSIEEIRLKKQSMLGEIYSILCMCLGQPPQSFSFRYEDKKKKVSEEKIMTPKEFLQDINFNFDDYVCLLNAPNLKIGEIYEIANMKNMIEAPGFTMLNVDIGIIKDAVRKSVSDGEAVWFSADAGRDMNRVSGLMTDNLYDYSQLLNIDLKTTKTDRILYYDTTASHAMVITGVDVKSGKAAKWLVENSWGKTPGEDGYFIMHDDWFDENVFQAIVHKKYLTKESLDALGKKAIVLPEFDILKGGL